MKTKDDAAMIKGSEKRQDEYAVNNLFIDRWSPRAMSGEAIPQEEFMILLEAARWAPSSYNNQPWRILYATRNGEYWPVFLDLLEEGNKSWAKNAGALVVFISKTTFDFNGKPSVTHSFDTGAAWENFALQGFVNGYAVHGMQGFNMAKAKAVLKIPEGFQIEAMAAVGKPGHKDALSPKLQESESPNNRRKLSETACEGRFKWTS